MKKLVGTWRPLARVIALALIAAAVPLPVLAGDSPSPAPATPGIRASMAKAVAAEPVAKAKASGQAAAPQGSQAPNLSSPSFFKTPAGIAVIAVLAAGTGYALYSTQHDRITSPGR